MNSKYPRLPDNSGTMLRYRDILVGDIHGGIDFTPALQAAAVTAWKNGKGKTMVLIMTDGDPCRPSKAEKARINRYVHQLRQRGRGKLRTRRIALKSPVRCYY